MFQFGVNVYFKMSVGLVLSLFILLCSVQLPSNVIMNILWYLICIINSHVTLCHLTK